MMRQIITCMRASINRDVVYSGWVQVWRLISGPLMLIFIPLFLSKETQGYWYSFLSVSALTVFADLGFTNIVLQFSAHEFAFLGFSRDFEVTGDKLHLNKLASLFIFTIKWSTMMSIVTFPMICLTGFLLFSGKTMGINWMLPWILYTLGSAISFLENTILSFVEGCDSVAKVQKIRFGVAVLNSLMLLGGLSLKFDLYALALASLLSAVTTLLYMYFEFHKLFHQLYVLGRVFRYSWKKDFFKLLWKYAIGCVSGYIVFQIYTPLVFWYRGPEAAGKVGISFQLWMAVFSMANVWIYIINPKLNILVSQRKWEQLDRLFKKHLIFGMGTFIVISWAIIAFFSIFKGRIGFLERFLDLFVLIILAIAWACQLMNNACQTYLRAHKEEPFVLFSIISALYVLITTYLCLVFLPIRYLFLGFVSQYIWGTFWVVRIFYQKRSLWHS